MECSLLLHDATGDRVIPFAANALQCFVNGEENPKTAPFSLDFVTLQEDRATAIGNMHRKIGKDRACGSGDMLADRQTYRERERERETDRQTDRHTDVLITILRHLSRGRSNYGRPVQFTVAEHVLHYSPPDWTLLQPNLSLTTQENAEGSQSR